jgi:hypothetical protein
VARSSSKILEALIRKPTLWELVDKDGNRLDDEAIQTRTAEEAALEFWRRSGNDVRKVENEPA